MSFFLCSGPGWDIMLVVLNGIPIAILEDLPASNYYKHFKSSALP
jgi:hypothetical protein